MSTRPEPSRHTRVLRTRLPWILTALVLLLGTGSAAYAFWQSLSSSNYAAAAADTINPGAKPAVMASGSALAVAWTAGSTTAGRPVTGYTVTRYSTATGGTGTPATGACAGTLTALTCTEQNVPGGTWYYTVTPAIALWAGAESPRSNGVTNDTTPPVAAVTSISPTPNAAGWNNTSPVTVTIGAQDNSGGSGVASITYAIDSATPVTVSSTTANIPVTGDGTHTVSYFATDNAGNSSASQNQGVKIDRVAPAAPTLSVPAYVNSTNVTAVPVTGTAEAGATVSLTARDSIPAHTVTASATVSGTGSWSVNSLNLSGLNQGTVSYSATVTDAAGNTGAAGAATGTKDTVAPAAPTLTVPTYVNSSNVTAVPVSGTAEAGGTVSLTVRDPGAAHTVTASATASGTIWSLATLNLTTLDQGTLTYSATVTDAAGNTGAASTATDTKDTAAPSAPTLSVPAYINSATAGSIQASGTAEAGTSVTLTVTDTGAAHTVTRTVTASGTGTWAVTALNLASFTDGTITFNATATDTAANTGAAGTATGTKDTVAPSAPTLSVPAYVNSTNVTAVPVSGTTEAGATISLTVRDAGSAHTVTASATASGTGSWSVSTLNLTTLDQGTVSYSATVTDAAGNTGAAGAATGTKDTVAPSAPTLSVPAYVNSANVTAVPVSGTAEAGGTVTLTVRDVGAAHTVTASATASGTGAWSFTTLNLSTLNEGTVSYSATATDAAGNTGTAGAATDTKDTVAPTAPTLSVPAYVNSANVTAVPVSGTAEAGGTVTLTVRDVGAAHTVTASATASGTGAWSFTTLNLTTLNQGTVSYSATITDAAANTGTAGAATDTKDTVAPTVTGFTLANGSGSPKSAAATADKGDTATIQYSEGIDPGKFCPGWNGGSALSGTVTLSDGGTNDTLTVSGTGCSSLAIGTMSLGGDYIGTTPAVFGSNGTASTLTWDPAANTLTIKLGSLSPNSPTPSGSVATGYPVYTPAAGLTDLAGNPLGTTTYTSGTKTGF